MVKGMTLASSEAFPVSWNPCQRLFGLQMCSGQEVWWDDSGWGSLACILCYWVDSENLKA